MKLESYINRVRTEYEWGVYCNECSLNKSLVSGRHPCGHEKCLEFEKELKIWLKEQGKDVEETKARVQVTAADVRMAWAKLSAHCTNEQMEQIRKMYRIQKRKITKVNVLMTYVKYYGL